MLQIAYKIGLAAALFGLVLLPSVSWGQGKKEVARRVQDEAHLFKQDAIDEANSIIAKIKAKHNRDLWVETLKEGPANTKEGDKWAVERFKNMALSGVYIVITTEPKHFEVVVGNKTRESGLFTIANRNEAAKILRKNLEDKKPNNGLIEVAKYTLDTMNEHARAKANVAPPVVVAQNAPPVVHNDPPVVRQAPVHHEPAGETPLPPWVGWVCIGLCVFLVIWVVFAIIRGIMNMFGGGGRMGYGGGGYGGGGMGYGGGYGGGGGGFMTGMLGGLFGAAAGMYLYNNVFGGHSSAYAGGSNIGGGNGVGGGTGVSNDPGADTDASATGGDYDADGGGAAAGGGGDWDDKGGGDADGKGGGEDADAGGGGDWGGGGDGGGGDAGGGDAGGGGDWGGGGDAGGGDAGGGGWFGGGGGGDAGGGGGGDWGGGGGGGDFGGGGGGGGDW